jgi:hypothetical protein
MCRVSVDIGITVTENQCMGFNVKRVAAISTTNLSGPLSRAMFTIPTVALVFLAGMAVGAHHAAPQVARA